MHLHDLCFFHTELSDEDIQDIVDVWRLADLGDLYPKLKLTATEVSNLQEVGNPKQQAKNVLTLWRNSKYPANNREDMLTAMGKNTDWARSMDMVTTKWAAQ